MQIILLYVPAKSPCKITLVNLTFILSDFSSLNAILWRYRKTRKSCGGCSITAWPTAGIHRYYQRPWHSRLGRHHYSHCRHSGDSLYHPSSIIEIVMMMMMTMMIIIKAMCDRNFRGILWFNLISLINVVIQLFDETSLAKVLFQPHVGYDFHSRYDFRYFTNDGCRLIQTDVVQLWNLYRLVVLL